MTAAPELFVGAAAGAAALLVLGLVNRSRAPAPVDRLREDDDPDSLIIRSPRAAEAGWLGRLDGRFEQAVGRTGMDISPAGTAAFIALCGVLAGGAAQLWKDNLLLSAGAAVAGLALPLAAVAFLQGRYRKSIQDRLPDAVYALARSLRAGLTLEQALETYARDGSKPLAEEFARVVGQMRLGADAPAALAAAAARIGLLDFNVLVSTVSLYRQTGGNLAILLDRLAAGIRDRNLFRGRFAAATAQGRVVAVVLAMFGPALLLGYAVFEPEHIAGFFKSSSGWMILLGCLALELVGAVWMWNLLRVDE
jgi:tight adherence protein B